MSDSPDPDAIIDKGVTSDELCKRFNERGDWERAKAGTLITVVIDSHPAPPEAHQPPGTRSEMLSFRTKENVEMSRAHRYLRPDGSIGGSGRPDPKKFFDPEKRVILRQKTKREIEAESKNRPT